MDSKSKLKGLFTEVLLGYSSFSFSSQTIYIKHFTAIEMARFNNRKNSFFEIAIKQNIPTIEEQLIYLKKENLWSDEKDKEIANLNYYLEGLKITKTKLWKSIEIEQINQQIKEAEKKIHELNLDKQNMIGYTAETYADKKLNEIFIFNTLYRDESLKEKFFTEYIFKELDEIELGIIVEKYNQKMEDFNSKNLRKIGFLDEFFSLFLVSEGNAYYFYGKPIVELSNFQIETFQYAKNFKNILSNSKTPPPQDVMSDPDKLEEWFNANKNAEEILEKGDKNAVATSLVGASKQDLEKLGIDTNQGLNLKDLAGKSFTDIVKAHGQ